MRTRFWMGSAVVMFSGCGLLPVPQPQSSDLKIIPEHYNRALVGQQVVLLVTVEDASGGAKAGDESVTLTAEAADCDVTVRTASLERGEVGEVVVVPRAMPSESTVTATVRGSRGDVEQSASVSFEVIDEVDDLGAEAAEYRDRFVAWLAENRPELGIDEQTEWEGTSVMHVLVVSHYLYFSEEWEMGLAWHIMIPPYDWAQMYLRRRFVEAAPSEALQIDSRSDSGALPHEIEPPDDVWR